MFINEQLLQRLECLLPAFEELEQELDRPIRMMAPHGQRMAVLTGTPWSPAQCGDYDLDVAQERGITLAPWTSRSRVQLHQLQYVPSVMYDLESVPGELLDNQLRIPTMYDQYMLRGGVTAGLVPLTIEGATFGEIEPRLIYYFLDLGYLPWPEALNFDLFFGDPIRVAAADDFEARMREARHEQAREALREWSVGAEERALTNVRTRISENESYLAQNIEAVAHHRNTLRDLGLQALALEAAAQDRSPDAWVDQYDRLIEHPRITDVWFETNKLIVTTDMMTMTHPLERDLTRTLGRMKVTFTLTPPSVTIQNLDYPREGRPHPHVENGGRPCFGNIENTVYQYLDDGQFLAAMEVLIAFFQTANARDDWGRYMRLWFGVPDALDLEAQEITEPEITEPEITEILEDVIEDDDYEATYDEGDN